MEVTARWPDAPIGRIHPRPWERAPGALEAGRLQVVRFESGAVLAPVASGVLASEDTPSPVASPELVPGHTEGSNVDRVSEMVTMLNSFKL